MQPAKAGPINFNRLQIDSSDPRYAALIAAEGDSLSSPSPSTESHTTVVSDGPSPSNQKSVDSEELRNVKRQLLQTQSALDMAARDLKQATDDGKKERERRKELEYHLLETQVKAESAKAAAKREIDRLEQKTQVVIYAITNQLLSSLHLLSKIRDAILPPSEVEKLANNTMAKPVKVSAVTERVQAWQDRISKYANLAQSVSTTVRESAIYLFFQSTRAKRNVSFMTAKPNINIESIISSQSTLDEQADQLAQVIEKPWYTGANTNHFETMRCEISNDDESLFTDNALEEQLLIYAGVLDPFRRQMYFNMNKSEMQETQEETSVTVSKNTTCAR
jgi:hypothetical protein